MIDKTTPEVGSEVTLKGMKFRVIDEKEIPTCEHAVCAPTWMIEQGLADVPDAQHGRCIQCGTPITFGNDCALIEKKVCIVCWLVKSAGDKDFNPDCVITKKTAAYGEDMAKIKNERN